MAERLVEEQRAQLGVPGVVVGQEQRGRDRVDVERARRVDRFPLKAYAASTLRVTEGDTVRAVPLAPADR